MNRILSFILCLLAFSGVAKAQDNVADEVIWLVGDEAVLRSDVEIYRLRAQLYNQRIPGDPYCYIPEQIAVQKLYLHQAKLDSVSVSESEVMRYVDYDINSMINDYGSQEKLEEYRGKPLSAIRDELRRSTREQLMIRQVQQSIVKSMKVTPADVRTFYDRIPKDSLPFIPTTVEVEIVTQEPTIELSEIDEVKRRLREFSEQVTTGQREFSTLARLYSECGSAKVGGELGFTGKAALEPEFAEVAFELNDPSKISRIVETENGFHIIQLIEKRGDRINVRHILLRPKVGEAELNETIARADSIRDFIQKGEFTFEYAASHISHDKDTRNNKGLMVNKPSDRYSERSGTSRFEMEELPPEIGKVVANLAVGEVSKPFSMLNSKNREVIAIVRLKSRTMGHKANISDDYLTLKAMVEDEKREKILDAWLQNKIKDTYIRINDNWKNCDFQIKGWLGE
ncbi:peptidyl-prolyl cis-trans isomerase SurA [Dysgonomonadaceae bacterium PH5-43]|nr:peptidyl-prolyl cis-trans isomerase SurA [Dysgonomonadaceae bacterium PH5-43]